MTDRIAALLDEHLPENSVVEDASCCCGAPPPWAEHVADLIHKTGLLDQLKGAPLARRFVGVLRHRQGRRDGRSENARRVTSALYGAQLVACAWGAHAMARRSTIRLKLRELVPASVPVVCLGKSAKGDPYHPARLANELVFLPFELP